MRRMRDNGWGASRITAGLLLAATIMLHPIAARAIDGVIEINQVKATAGGVTAGDAAGLPVTIDEPGSYRLTGDLTMPDANTVVIRIDASGVTLDLNGFTITGPNTCAGPPVSCTASGTGTAIQVSIGAEAVEIRNGSIIGAGNSGIARISPGAGPGMRVENVRVRDSAGTGIDAGRYSTIVGCEATLGGTDGFSVGEGSIVRGNRASNNGTNGFTIAGGSLVLGNTAVDNAAQGIQVIGADSVIADNVTGGNGLNGLLASDASVVARHTSHQNTEDGITGSNDILIADSICTGNLVYGLAILNTTNAYRRSLMNDNNGGNGNAQVIGGTELDDNLCGGDATCP